MSQFLIGEMNIFFNISFNWLNSYFSIGEKSDSFFNNFRKFIILSVNQSAFSKIYSLKKLLESRSDNLLFSTKSRIDFYFLF